MRILLAASEMVPFAKTGGLGDVIGALPQALAGQGHDVRVFIPHYGFLDTADHHLEPLGWTLRIPVADKHVVMSLSRAVDRKSGLKCYFVGNPDYFNRRGLYGHHDTKQDFVDNDERFAFFSRAILETARKLAFRPDIVHLHDWQTALVAVYLKTVYSEDPFFADTKSVLTIHNLAHQGNFDAARFDVLGLSDGLIQPTASLEFFGQMSYLKGGIVLADQVTTVSPRYAQEIQTGKFGCGLDGVLRERSGDLHGILNGVDYGSWSPSRDNLLPHKYHPANLSGKRMNKIELLGVAGLPVRQGTPLVGMITRLVHQKGLDLIRDAADRMFAMDLQMVVLGTGEEKYHKLLTMLENKYPDKLKVYLAHDERLAHLIEGAADIFLMPSLFEPCGLNQMYSLKYGTVPIVNSVGGLVDTVVDCDPEDGSGTGFVFNEETPEALLGSLDRALTSFARRRLWMKIMKAGMKQDFSWRLSVKRYLSLFEQLVGQHRMTVPD
ncbi:MAG: glycogen synthase GlgA [candidate division Zixibacteria bacterium]|nr:glycogen synthase GlgA [candidate division Zixibacteria bacterium]MDH3938505.1 glycogen synthase GlgA [candidate division Zixibacteria bacterium]MDH4034922.1 glycogen synthase GlgA [candidate division Zixibacteria bacterium]